MHVIEQLQEISCVEIKCSNDSFLIFHNQELIENPRSELEACIMNTYEILKKQPLVWSEFVVSPSHELFFKIIRDVSQEDNSSCCEKILETFFSTILFMHDLFHNFFTKVILQASPSFLIAKMQRAILELVLNRLENKINFFCLKGFVAKFKYLINNSPSVVKTVFADYLRKYNLRYVLRRGLPKFCITSWDTSSQDIDLSLDFLKITTHLLEAIPSLLNSEYLIKKYCDKINQLRQEALNIKKDDQRFILICFKTFDLFDDVISKEFIPLLQEASCLEDLNYKFSKMKDLSIQLSMPSEVLLQKTFIKMKNRFNDSNRKIKKPLNAQESIDKNIENDELAN